MTKRDRLKDLVIKSNKLDEDRKILIKARDALSNELDEMTDIVDELKETKYTKDNLKKELKKENLKTFIYVLGAYLVGVITFTTAYITVIFSSDYIVIPTVSFLKKVALFHILASLVAGRAISVVKSYKLKKQVKNFKESDLEKMEEYTNSINEQLSEVMRKLEVNRNWQSKVVACARLIYNSDSEDKEVVEEVKREEEKGMTLERRKIR